jgi:hypothetical protein
MGESCEDAADGSCFRQVRRTRQLLYRAHKYRQSCHFGTIVARLADGLSVDPGLQAQPPSLHRACSSGQSGASWPTLVGSMAPIPHPVYTRFLDHPATPAHGCAPTSELGLHTTSYHHKCSARWCFHRQLHRLVPLPLGLTIQPRSRTRAASSQLRLAMILFTSCP